MGKNGASKVSTKSNTILMTIGAILAVGGSGFAAASRFALWSTGILIPGAAILIALGVILFVVNLSKRINKQKMNQNKKKSKNKVEVSNKSKEKVKKDEKVESSKVESSTVKSSTPTLDKYATSKIEPNTFAIYDVNSDKVLKDAKSNPRIYKIETDSLFSKGVKELPNLLCELNKCKVKVFDEDTDCVEENVINAKSYRDDMLPVLKAIKNIRTNLLNEKIAQEDNLTL